MQSITAIFAIFGRMVKFTIVTNVEFVEKEMLLIHHTATRVAYACPEIILALKFEIILVPYVLKT